MKCTICKVGETAEGSSVVTLNRDGIVVVFKSVPSQVCNNCGEIYIEDNISRNLLATSEEISKSGVQIDIRDYRAA